MKTFISMLRGINVGGHHQIKMDLLRQLYCDLGFFNVISYIQSGNVIFQTDEKDTFKLEKKISMKIFDIYNINVPVLVLTIDEFKTIIRLNPFIGDETKDPNFLHVTFLSYKIEEISFEELKISDYGKDEFELIEKVIYLYCPTGYGNTKLTNTFFEKKLKVNATTRNWKTVNQLVRLANNF